MAAGHTGITAIVVIHGPKAVAELKEPRQADRRPEVRLVIHGPKAVAELKGLFARGDSGVGSPVIHGPKAVAELKGGSSGAP